MRFVILVVVGFLIVDILLSLYEIDKKLDALEKQCNIRSTGINVSAVTRCQPGKIAAGCYDLPGHNS